MALPHSFSIRIEDLQGRGELFTLTDPDWNRKAIPESFGTRANAGYDQAEISMFRSDFRIFSTPHEQQMMKIIDGGNQVVHESRVLPIPKGTGKNTVKGSGMIGHLSDLGSFPRIWVDQTIANWTGMALTRQAAFGVGGLDFASLSYAAQGGGLVCALPTSALAAQVAAEGWYTAPNGALIGRVDYKGARTSWPAGWSAPILRATPTLDSGTGETAYAPTLDNTLRTINLTAARRQIYIEAYSASVATTPTLGANEAWSILRVYGDHGMTPAQLTVSNVIRDILKNGAPLLNYDSNSIDENNTLITQMINTEKDTPLTAMQRANGYALWEPAVWNDRKFHFHAPKDLTRADWILDKRLGDEFKPSDQGNDEDLAFSGVWAVYTDVATNRTERVGPLGNGWGQDATGASTLLDTSDDNPCNQENQPRYAVLEIGPTIDRATAILIATLWLTENRLPSRAATGRAGPYVRDPAGNFVPSYFMRQGDRVKYMHDDTIFRLYTTNFKVLGGINDLAFNNAPSTLDGFFERLGTKLAGVMQ